MNESDIFFIFGGKGGSKLYQILDDRKIMSPKIKVLYIYVLGWWGVCVGALFQYLLCLGREVFGVVARLLLLLVHAFHGNFTSSIGS